MRTPLTPASAWTAWQVDLPVLLAAAVAMGLYAWAVAARTRTGGSWPAARTVSFGLGLLVMLATTCSFVGVYAHTLLWVFTLQTCVLLLLVPLLLGGGGPLALVPWPLPRGLVRALTVPGAGPLLLIVVTAVVFFTPLLGAAVSSSAITHALQLILVLCGLVMALPVTDESVALSSNGYAALLGLGLVELLLDAVPGIALRLHPGVLTAAASVAAARGWGPTAIGDQQLAGDMLWFFGEAADIPFIVITVVAWIRADAREAVRVDAALDAAVLARRAAAPRTSAVLPASDQPADGLDRPWWLADPTVFGEDRARRYGWRPPEEDEPG